MAARRILSFLLRSRVQNPLFPECSSQFLPSTNACFRSTSRYGFSTAGNAKESSLNPLPDSSANTQSNEKSRAVKYSDFSNLKVSPRHDLAMIFTCKVCETRTMKPVCRESYENGVVVARCDGCNNLHLIADRLGWFGEPGSVEDFLAARGEEVKRCSLDSLNLTLEDLAGKKP